MTFARLFEPGWPERAAHTLVVALLALAALLAAFTLADAATVRGRARAARRAWARAAAETTTVEARTDGTQIARTTTERTARRLLHILIGDEEL